MRVITLLALCLTFFAPLANAQIPPRQSTVDHGRTVGELVHFNVLGERRLHL
jgi:hypothetical protein